MKVSSQSCLTWINWPAVRLLKWNISQRAKAMIRTTSPNSFRANFGRCTACAVRSLSVCGALNENDLAEFERIARHIHLAPNEALFTVGQAATSVHNMTAGVARLY